MTVIFADASLCPDTGAAGWGCWIKGSGPAIEAGGPFKERYENICRAELAAIANAVHVAKAHGRINNVVMIQSDSMSALSALIAGAGAIDNPAPGGLAVGRRRRINDETRRIVEHIRAMLPGVAIGVRHVKGHKGGDHRTGQGRNWVNRRCDKLAKEGLRAARQEVSRT